MPSILYCLEVYSGCSRQNLRKLQLAFNRVMRYLYSVRKFDHISHCVRSFLGCTFNEFVEVRALIFFYKIYKTRCPLFLFNSFRFCHSIRNRQLLIPKITTLMERSYIVRIAREFNSLPSSLKDLNSSIITFRKNILQHINTTSQYI